jgi:hypothetical protein
MGLDISHNCWHGSYTSFNYWRTKLAEVAGYGDLADYRGHGGAKKFPSAKGDVLVELLSHSDCDGELETGICTRLANRLEELLPAMSEPHDAWTKQFISGLRKAAARGQKVTFR